MSEGRQPHGARPAKRSRGQGKLKHLRRMPIAGWPRSARRALARWAISLEFPGLDVPALYLPCPPSPQTPPFLGYPRGSTQMSAEGIATAKGAKEPPAPPPPLTGISENGAQQGEVAVLGRSPLPPACAPGGPGRGFLRPIAQRADRARRQDRRYLQRYRGRQSAHGAADRARRPSRGPRRQDAPARQVRPLQRRLGRDGGQRQFADRRSSLADDRGDPGDRRRRQGRPAADRSPGCRRPPAARRIPALGQYRQHHDQAAQRLHLRGHPRGPRGGNGRQARRPGPGARGDGGLEGSDRERQFDGQQPDGAGPQYRRGHHRGRQWRPVEEDHRRRARRDPAAEGGHQHDGRSAPLLRLGSDARRARGRHRRQARRPGDGARRGRHLEGSDGFGQCHVRQSDRPGPQYRPGDHGRRPRRSLAQDHGGCPRRDPGAEGHHQHHGGSAQFLRLGGDARGARGRHRRQARRPGRRARRGGDLEGPDRQCELHGQQSDGPGPQHRRGRDRHCRRRSVQEDHRHRQRRDPAAEGDHQHDGRSAERFRRRGHSRGPRGRHRGAAGRPGQCAGRGRHLEGSRPTA